MFKVPLAKSPRFHVEAQLKPHTKTLHLQFFGEVSEDTDFSSVSDYIFGMDQDVKLIAFDLKGVTRLNSVGVIQWINFLAKVQSRIRCRFESLNAVFVDQLSKISTILGRPGTPVDAVLLPYICDKCKKSSEHLIEARNLGAASSFDPPELKCADCNGTLFFDDIPESYVCLLNFMSPTK